MSPTPAHITWCQRLMDGLREGGVWGVPRSGLVYHKRGKALVLTARMPHHDALPMTPQELLSLQTDDHAMNVDHFTKAGYEVHDETLDPKP